MSKPMIQSFLLNPVELTGKEGDVLKLIVHFYGGSNTIRVFGTDLDETTTFDLSARGLAFSDYAVVNVTKEKDLTIYDGSFRAYGLTFGSHPTDLMLRMSNDTTPSTHTIEVTH